MKLVTDPKVLAQLRGSDLKPVTDPNVLAQLNGQSNSPENPDSLSNSPEASFVKGLGSAAKGTAADLATVGQSIGNIPGNLVNSVRGLSPFLANHIDQQNTGNIDFRNLLGADQGEDKNNPLAYGAGKFLGNAGAFIGGGEALDTARGLAEGAPLIGKAAQYLGGQGMLPTMGRLGAGGALYGAGTNPENPLAGGAIGGALGAAAGGLGAGISKLMPSNFLRGNLSPEELAKNAAVAGNTQTGLGQVVESPFLKKLYENKLAVNPASGADAISANVETDIKNKGHSLLNKYLGDTDPSMVDSTIKGALEKAAKEQVATKNALYQDVNDIANKSDLKLELPRFAQKANSYTKLMNDQNFLKFEPEAESLLKRLANYKDADVQQPTLQESNILAGKLNGLAGKYAASSAADDRYTASVLGKLGSALKTDIRRSVANSGNDELINAFTKAESNYKQNYVPYLDKDIYKFTNGGKDSDDLISSFIKTGGNTDKANQLDKLMGKLPPDAKDLVKYSYLSRAFRGPEDGRYVEPNALKGLWNDNKLGQRQKAVLFSDPAERKSFDDFSKLTSMNTDNLSRMFNPQTGKRALDMMSWGAKGLGGAIGAGVGSYEGGTPGAAVGGIAGMAAPAIAARYLTKKLTDPAYRNALIQKMLNPSQSKLGTGLLSKSILANVIPGMTQ